MRKETLLVTPKAFGTGRNLKPASVVSVRATSTTILEHAQQTLYTVVFTLADGQNFFCLDELIDRLSGAYHDFRCFVHVKHRSCKWCECSHRMSLLRHQQCHGFLVEAHQKPVKAFKSSVCISRSGRYCFSKQSAVGVALSSLVISHYKVQGPILELAIEFAGLEGEVEQFNMSAISMQPRERHESTHERKIHGAPVNFNTEVDDNDLLLCTATSKYTNKRPHPVQLCHGQEALVWKPASRCRSPNARSRSGAMMSSPPLDAVGVEFKALRSQRVVRGSSGLTRRGAIEAGRGPDRSLSLVEQLCYMLFVDCKRSCVACLCCLHKEARQITRTGIVLDGGHRFGALRRTIQTR
ncbi:hypothetical protein KCU96_g23, partial [Aureobasidium melanogenum]